MKPTLIIIIERARAILKNALHRVIVETKLPAYMIEGILLDLLADVREQKATELAAEYTELAVEYEDAIKQIPTPTGDQDPKGEDHHDESEG